jgi:GTP cyclohydrolase II
MSDPSAKLALRVHDECNGSDVFGSDICTCRPYLTFGIEEAVKEAQAGGSGVVIYFRKEGRALGEVTKYLVYNARKRGEDRASEYFQRTENIAGVKDMRFQALMPDILHWLGITKIDRMLSMSNMKHDAIVEQGIPIIERVPIPDDMIPADSRVEIDAKIQAGYCMSSPHPVTPSSCPVGPQFGHFLPATIRWSRAYADICSYHWSRHVHGRAGKRKGPWLGRHRRTWDDLSSYLPGERYADPYRSTEKQRHACKRHGGLETVVIWSFPACSYGTIGLLYRHAARRV